MPFPTAMGAVQLSVALWLPVPVTVGVPGADGTPGGLNGMVKPLETLGPAPTLFTALTAKV